MKQSTYMKYITKKSNLIAICLFFLIFSLSTLAKEISLSARIEKHLNPLQTFNVDYGILILAVDNMDTKKIFARKITHPLMPASNEKLITTIGAVNKLGENFKFQTILGMMNNNLIIIGDGDAGFGDMQLTGKSACEIFDEWAQVLIEKGITHIKGNMIFLLNK